MNSILRTRGARLLAIVACAFTGGVWFQSWHAPARSPTAPARADDKPKEPPPGWLTGTAGEKFAQIERHLRGLDVTMAEIGYRYGELLQAGKARNWEYAQYQAEKIDLSLRLAIERRPKRAQSAKPFLEIDVPRLLNAVKGKDPKQLDSALESLHNACIACHMAEKVVYFQDAVERIKQRAAR